MKTTLIILTDGDLLRLKHCLAAVAVLSTQADQIIVTVDPKPGLDAGKLEKSITALAKPFGVGSQRDNAIPLRIHKVVIEGEPSDAFRPGTARNNGARYATGDRLIFLDGDCVVDPDFVEAHAAATGIGFGFRRMLPEPPEDVLKAGLTPDQLAKAGMESRLRAAQFVSPVPPSMVFGFSISVPRQTFQDLGGFDESLDGQWGGSEDLDLATRASRIGEKPFALTHSGHVTHIGHQQKPIREDATELRELVISDQRPLVANADRPFAYHSDTAAEQEQPEAPAESPSDGAAS